MQLADEITITVDGERFVLRPSLRAAIRLERKHGFDKLVRAIADGSLSHIADVVRECSQEPSELPDFLERLAAPHGLKRGLDAITVPVLDLVFALAGVDENEAWNGSNKATNERGTSANTPRVTWEDHFKRLFSIGTGWLGWSVRDTLDATPAEILAGYEGKLDMLKAVFGGGEEKEEPKPELSLYDKANLIFGGMKRTVVHLPQEENSSDD